MAARAPNVHRGGDYDGDGGGDEGVPDQLHGPLHVPLPQHAYSSGKSWDKRLKRKKDFR